LLYTFPGFFGEVFRGIWNGTDVAIKVFLEQDLTAENMEDFCNEISILRYFAMICCLSVIFMLHPTFTDSSLLFLSFAPYLPAD